MISIIIVSYNASELLLRCINFCRSLKTIPQTPDFEVIVVDNNSSDNAQDYVTRTYPDVIWKQNDRNLGFAAAVNQGLNIAEGDYFLLLNPDSEISSNALAALTSFWSHHPDAGIVGGKIVNSDGTFQKQCRRNFPEPASAFFRLFKLEILFPNHRLKHSYERDLDDIETLHEVDAVAGAFMCFPRTLTEEIGMFDEGYFLMGEDLDFCHRAKLAGKKVFYYPEVRIVHHHGASRQTRLFTSYLNGHHAMIRYFRKFLRQKYSRLSAGLVYTGIVLHCVSLSAFSLLKFPFRRSR